MTILIMTPKEKEIYWKGFEDGKNNALKHNIQIMKLQMTNVYKEKQRSKKK